MSLVRSHGRKIGERISKCRHTEPDVSNAFSCRLVTANKACRLFVKNLPEKINKNELKRALYMLFSTYGPILDIVTSRVGAKGQQMRGQAHVVFRDIQTSTQAMRALHGFDFFGKEMVKLKLSTNAIRS